MSIEPAKTPPPRRARPRRSLAWRLLAGVGAALPIALIAILGLVATGALEAEPPDVHVERNVAYQHVDGQPVTLDIAWPKAGGGPRPVLVFLHGGGWVREGAAFRREFMAAAQRGYVGVRVSYRLLEIDDGQARNPFPTQRDDILEALRWLSEHRHTYRADLDRVGLVGASAGAHLALALGLPGGRLEEESEDAIAIRAIVDMYGPVDLEQAWHARPKMRGLLEAMLGGTPHERPAAYHEASPLRLVSRRSPPVLILHGRLDPRVPWQQSEQLAKALRRAGVDHELIVFDKARHGFDGAAHRKASAAMYRFLEERLAHVPNSSGATARVDGERRGPIP